jgi:hypothetical protein
VKHFQVKLALVEMKIKASCLGTYTYKFHVKVLMVTNINF